MAKKRKKGVAIDIQPGSFVAYDIKGCIERLDAILVKGTYPHKYWTDKLTPSVRLDLFVCLDDLLQKANNATNGDLRVRFPDDVQITDDVEDVTDLINKCRNAAAHISSPLKKLNEKVIFTSVCAGQSNVMYIEGRSITSDYIDDIAIFYGNYRIYFIRHIVRAYHEVKRKLIPLIARPGQIIQ